MLRLVLAEILLLKVVEEVAEGIQGNDPRPRGVHPGRVVEDARGGHRVKHLLLVAPALKVCQIQ